MGDKRVYIMDVYNRHIYPGDRFAKRECPPPQRARLSWALSAGLPLRAGPCRHHFTS